MISLNFNNVEEIIFKNKQLCAKLSDFQPQFNQWHLAQQHSYLKPMGKQAKLSFLKNLKPEHIQIIEDFYNSDLSVHKLNYELVKNRKCKIDDLLSTLEEFSKTDLCIYREGDEIYLSSWR